MEKLPARTQSREIQKRHLRRYDSGKVTLVNPKVTHKLQPLSRDYTHIKKPIILTPQIPKRELTPPPQSLTKYRWTRQFNIDKSKKELSIQQIIDEMKELDIKLNPGEFIARKITNIEIPKFTSITSINYIDIEGNKQSLSFQISNDPVTRKFMDFLMDAKRKGKKVIFKTKINDDITYIQGPGGIIMGAMQGTIDVEYVRPYGEAGPKLKLKPFTVLDVSDLSPDGILIRERGGDSEKVRIFKNREELREKIFQSTQEKRDILGRKWDPQEKLTDFTPKPKIPVKDMVAEWRKEVLAELRIESKPVKYGWTKDNKVYEMLKGPDLFDRSRTIFMVTIFDVINNRISEPTKGEGGLFKSREKAERYLSRWT